MRLVVGRAGTYSPCYIPADLLRVLVELNVGTRLGRVSIFPLSWWFLWDRRLEGLDHRLTAVDHSVWFHRNKRGSMLVILSYEEVALGWLTGSPIMELSAFRRDELKYLVVFYDGLLFDAQTTFWIHER